jgi:hypothetical protein
VIFLLIYLWYWRAHRPLHSSVQDPIFHFGHLLELLGHQGRRSCCQTQLQFGSEKGAGRWRVIRRLQVPEGRPPAAQILSPPACSRVTLVHHILANTKLAKTHTLWGLFYWRLYTKFYWKRAAPKISKICALVLHEQNYIFLETGPKFTRGFWAGQHIYNHRTSEQNNKFIEKELLDII